MSFFYELVGRLVVAFVRIRYRRRLRLAAALAVAAAVAAGHALATRHPEES